MAEEKSLPGWPTKKLVREVKSVLWRYVRSRPQIADPLWVATWEWASTIESRNQLFNFAKRRRRRWPADYEIATQYLLLALTEMKTSCMLRLPYEARNIPPPECVARILNQNLTKTPLLSVTEEPDT